MSDDRRPRPHPPVSPALAPLLSGRVGKYEIAQPLGKGAMGVVYLAHDTVLERDVALKVMSPQIADDPDLKQRFEREAKAVARMTHPNVVQVYDLGQHEDGSLYIAMELLKGLDLQKTLRTQPPMTLERKVGTVLQVLAGLHHAHQAGIVHRDIKPANIFLCTDGPVKIMDFGVARLTTASMTGTGNIVGTADYMSPEQVKGAKVDGRSDLFSAGAVLFELLAGRRPFHADNLMAIFYKITHDEPNYELIPAGEDYDALLPAVRRALAKSVDERYPSAYEFAIDLRTYLATHSTSLTGRHVLENLVDLEAPGASLPSPFSTGVGPTLVEGLGSLSGSGELARPGSFVPTAPMTAPPSAALAEAGAPTERGRPRATLAGGAVAPGALPPTLRPAGPVRAPAASRPAPAAARGRTPGPAPRSFPLWVPGLVLVALALAGGAWWFLGRPRPVAPVPTASLAPSATPAPNLPSPSQVAEASPVPDTTPGAPPPTPAPMPSVALPAGPGAADLRAAQGAFARGDYERALSEAQAALRRDTANVEARRLADNALKGQQALQRLAAGETALAQGDQARALAEGEAARDAAPWDTRVSAFLARVREAQQRASQAAAQQASARVGALLKEADDALGARRFDQAVALYDEALKLDPQNQRASLGRTGALAARAAAAPASGRAFVAGTTVAKGGARPASSGPAGFEDAAEVNARKASQAADMPGKLLFEVTPANVRPGERYSVRIALLNEGLAPIQVTRLVVSTAVNGRRSSGPVTPSVKEVAPQQRAVLHSVSDLWSEETATWSMEVAVTSARGETYTNTLNWK